MLMDATAGRLACNEDAGLGVGLEDRADAVYQMLFANATGANVAKKAHQALLVHANDPCVVAEE